MSRVRLGAVSLVISGVFFVLYPALRPFSDETSLQGAAAFASPGWTLSHTLAIVAFTLLPLGLLGLWAAVEGTPGGPTAFRAFAVSVIGTGLTLPFYGAETYGLRAIGLEATRQNNVALVGLASEVRGGPGLAIFAVGLLLLAVSAIMAAAAIWRSGRAPRWSGIPFAVGLALYLPQFLGTQPLRVAHGLLVAVGCWWMAAVLRRHSR